VKMEQARARGEETMLTANICFDATIGWADA
jgi:hypothetical protein